MLTIAATVHYGPFSHSFDVTAPDDAVEDEVLALDGGVFPATLSASNSADGLAIAVSTTLPVLGGQSWSKDVPLSGVPRKIEQWLLGSGRAAQVSLSVSKS